MKKNTYSYLVIALALILASCGKTVERNNEVLPEIFPDTMTNMEKSEAETKLPLEEFETENESHMAEIVETPADNQTETEEVDVAKALPEWIDCAKKTIIWWRTAVPDCCQKKNCRDTVRRNCS